MHDIKLAHMGVTPDGICRIFSPLVKKTYLTLVYLTVVSTSKIKGFVLEKKNFPEDVQKTPLLLKWAREKG